MEKRDAWAALFIYFMSAEIIWTIVSISLPWWIWLLGQPFLFIVSALMVGLTAGGRDK